MWSTDGPIKLFTSKRSPPITDNGSPICAIVVITVIFSSFDWLDCLSLELEAPSFVLHAAKRRIKLNNNKAPNFFS